MSEILPLLAIPNQNFNALLDGSRYEITIKAIGNGVAVTIYRNEVLIAENVRAQAAVALLPYDYLRGGKGNFIFTSDIADLAPEWQTLGSVHQLVYVPDAELRALRDG